jgi:hypothetical protein
MLLLAYLHSHLSSDLLYNLRCCIVRCPTACQVRSGTRTTRKPAQPRVCAREVSMRTEASEMFNALADTHGGGAKWYSIQPTCK